MQPHENVTDLEAITLARVYRLLIGLAREKQVSKANDEGEKDAVNLLDIEIEGEDFAQPDLS